MTYHNVRCFARCPCHRLLHQRQPLKKKENKRASKLRYSTDCPSSHGVDTVVMKNCDVLVFGPVLAIDKRPDFECLHLKFSSGKYISL